MRKRVEELEAESAEHSRTIEKLEADKVRLYYKIGHLSIDAEEWEKNFDPSEYTVPVEEMLADLEKLVQESGEPTRG